MKEIKLTQGYVALVDDEDFEKVNAYKWHAYVAFREDGTIRTVYAVNKTKTTLRMHRFILGPEGMLGVDHKDHNGLNNQKHNLRPANDEQNQRNQKLSGLNTSGFKGVSFVKLNKNWRAYIRVGGVLLHLGCYASATEAAAAYDASAIKYFGEFALTNAMMTLDYNASPSSKDSMCLAEL